MTTGSRTAQLVALGEGLALGAIMLGLPGINGSKAELEWGFRRAWRQWTFSALFPAINAGPSRDDVLLHAIQRSDRRRGPIVAHWEGSYPFVPVILAPEWGFGEAAVSIHDAIPADGWRELVSMWLDEEGRPRRAPTRDEG